MGNVRAAFKKIQLDRVAAEHQKQAATLVRYLSAMCQECMNSYGKLIDGKGIKIIQEALLSIGFAKTAEHAYATWKETQLKAAEAAEAAAAAAEKEKGGGKDDKKKAGGKDD